MRLTQWPMFLRNRSTRSARLIAFAALAIASCGGGSSAPPYYTIGGTVHGLAGSGLVLQENGGGDLAVATNGPFKFGTAVVSGHNYAVTIAAQPSNPSQACIVSSSAGVVTNGPVTDVSVNCTNTYAVGGTVTGLDGSGLVLADNGSDQLPVPAKGLFTFSTKVPRGSAYHVTVASQPTNPIQNCIVQNGSRDGTVTDGDVTSLSVVCADVGKFAYFSYYEQCAKYIEDAIIPDPMCFFDLPYGTNVDPYAIDPSSGALNSGTLIGAFDPFYYFGDVVLSTDGHYLIENLPPREGGAGIAAGLVQFAIVQTGSSVPPGSVSPPIGINANFFGSLCSAPQASPDLFGSQGNGLITELQGVSPIGVELGTVAAQPAGGAPILACDPLGRFVYSIYASTGSVSVYTISAPTGGGSAGTLGTAPGSPFAVGQTLTAIGTEPFGKFVFIANSNGSVKPASETISTLAVDAAGLTTVSIIATPAGKDLTQIIVDPSGTFLYALNGSNDIFIPNVPGSNDIYAFAINPVSGQLSSIPGSPFSAGNVAVGANTIARMAIDPSGKFLFVGQQTSSAVSEEKVLITVYQIDANSGVPKATTAPLLIFYIPEEDVFLTSIAISK